MTDSCQHSCQLYDRINVKLMPELCRDSCQVYGRSISNLCHNYVKYMSDSMPDIMSNLRQHHVRFHVRLMLSSCQTHANSYEQTYVIIHVKYMTDLCQKTCQTYAISMPSLCQTCVRIPVIRHAKLVSKLMSNCLRNHVQPMSETRSNLCQFYAATHGKLMSSF